MRRTLTAFSAITLIPLTYTLLNRNDSVEKAGTKPVDLQGFQSHSKRVMAHQCGQCSHDHSAATPRDTASNGLIWEHNDSAAVPESMLITNGLPLSEHYLPGTRQQLILDDGTEVDLDVRTRFVHQDGTVAVDAVLAAKEGQPEGRLHLQWNDADQFFLGQIEYPNHPVAYEIANNEDGETRISRRSIDQLLCSEVDPVTQEVRYGLPGVDAALAVAADLGEEAAGIGEEEITEESAMLVPSLNSYPSAQAVIYLDFDGEVVKGTSWGTRITAEPTGYSASKITDIWKRVAADMEPFNLNVTTDEALYLSTPSNRRIRCIITPSNEWYSTGSLGGVAKRSSFVWSGDTPCWVFSDNLLNGTKYIAECCSHEVGHTLGLAHDGKGGTTYYTGHGSGAVGWAPIMGSSYYKALSQWSKGEYSGATNTQDDLAIIASATNGFGYRTDDHGNQQGTATVLTGDEADQVAAEGVIERHGDVDVFKLHTESGSLSIDLQIAGAISNLDIEARLYDDQGQLLMTANPATLLTASINTQVGKGVYYLHVGATGYGSADTGSSDYASLGQYWLSGQLPPEDEPTPYELSVSELEEAQRAPEADPDGDGRSNLEEHLTGTEPGVADHGGSVTWVDSSGVSGADFLIDLPAQIPADALYTVEATCDLAGNVWTEVARCDGSGVWTGEATVVEESGPEGKRRFRITDDSGQDWTCRFMRVRFELAPGV